MAFRKLGSLFRESMRARTCPSSPGIVVKGGGGIGGVERSRCSTRPASSVPMAVRVLWRRRAPLLLPDAVAAAGPSAFAGCRGLHSTAAAQMSKVVRVGPLAHSLTRSRTPAVAHTAGTQWRPEEEDGSRGSTAGRGARRFHALKDEVVEHADGAVAALSIAVFTGILYIMKDTDELDEPQEEDTPSRTDPYLRSHQLMEETKREMASYNKTMVDEKAVVQEYMEDDQVMRARFEVWMKEYGKTYKDEVEKARRFKIFKSVARFADASTADAAKAGHSNRFGVNEYSDWNAEEMARLYGGPASRVGGYLQMVMSYLAPQGIWHQEASAKNKESED